MLVNFGGKVAWRTVRETKRTQKVESQRRAEVAGIVERALNGRSMEFLQWPLIAARGLVKLAREAQSAKPYVPSS